MLSRKVIIGISIAVIIVSSIILISAYSNDSESEYAVSKPRKLSPITGYEHDWDLEWWKNFKYRKHHNCYDYAFGHIRFEKRGRSQPGTLNGDKVLGDKYTCDIIVPRLESDHDDIRRVDFEEQCEANEYKIALMAAPGFTPYSITSDYHFMRQDSNGLWSHKPGKNMPTNLDGDENLIYAPHLSNRDFGAYNYKDMCGYWCVSRDANDRFN